MYCFVLFSACHDLHHVPISTSSILFWHCSFEIVLCFSFAIVFLIYLIRKHFLVFLLCIIKVADLLCFIYSMKIMRTKTSPFSEAGNNIVISLLHNPENQVGFKISLHNPTRLLPILKQNDYLQIAHFLLCHKMPRILHYSV